jgi:isopentenyl-diphosphate delta-isomerase type 1
LSGGSEWVVLVDEADREIGVAPKRDVHHAATPLHRAFSLFLFDGAGRTLLQQRAATKLTWPGVWSNACCGHPAPGEATADAVARRCRQELGVAPRELTLALPRYRYRAEARGVVENEICPVFVAAADPAALAPDPAEVAACRWVDWADFLAALPGDFSPWCVAEARLLAASGALAPFLSTPRRGR